MKASSLALALAAMGAIVPWAAEAAVPVVDGVGKPAMIRCGTHANGAVVRASHADKIVFAIVGHLVAQQPDDQPALDKLPRNTQLDIKVLDDPRTVADISGKVLTFLGALDMAENRASLRIVEVKYAMVCPTTAAP